MEARTLCPARQIIQDAMNKKLLALVGGAGVATGILIAPDKGSRTIKKLSNRGRRIIDSVKKTANGTIRDKVSEVKDVIRSGARAAATAAMDAEERLHRRFQSAIKSAVKATGREPLKKTSGRSGAARKSRKQRTASMNSEMRAEPGKSIEPDGQEETSEILT